MPSAQLFCNYDQLGRLVQAVYSGGGGAVSNKNPYDPFGMISTMSGTTFGFTGQRFDPELGLYYFKRRYYSPTLGRFLQADPIGYTGEDFNLYSYARNSPLRFVDPMGLQTKVALLPPHAPEIGGGGDGGDGGGSDHDPGFPAPGTQGPPVDDRFKNDDFDPGKNPRPSDPPPGGFGGLTQTA